MPEIEKHFGLSDKQFEQRFANLSIDPVLFSHEGHLRLAWILTKKYDLDKAIQLACRFILNFNIRHGKGDKFHKTITVASIYIVNQYIQKSKSSSFSDFITEFPTLSVDLKSLIDAHYSYDVFKNKRAWTEYIKPDKLPFDC